MERDALSISEIWLLFLFFFRFVFILSALLTYYCRSVSSFSNAKAGIPDSLWAVETAMLQRIERVQKSAENEYSSGNGHFSHPQRELSSNLFRIFKFVPYWCDIYVCNMIRQKFIGFSVSDLNEVEILPTR